MCARATIIDTGADADDPHSPRTAPNGRPHSAHWPKDDGFNDNDDDAEPNGRIVGVLAPRLALSGNVLQAGLTIAPSAHGNLVQRSSTRRPASNHMHSGHNSTNNSPSIAFPTRHSKSFDQLRLSAVPNGGPAASKNGHHTAAVAATIDGDASSAMRLEKSKSVAYKLDGSHNEVARSNSNGWPGELAKTLPSRPPCIGSAARAQPYHAVDKHEHDHPNPLAVMRSAYVIVSRNATKSKLNATIPDYRAMRPMVANHRSDASERPVRLVSSVLDIKSTLDGSELPLSSSVPTHLEELNRTVQVGSESLPNLSQHTERESYSIDSDAANLAESSSSNGSAGDASRTGSLTLFHELYGTQNGNGQRTIKHRSMNSMLSDCLNHIECEADDDWFEDKPIISLKALSPARSHIDSATLTAVLSHSIENGHNGDSCPITSLSVANLSEKKLDFNLLLLTPPDQFRDPPLGDNPSEHNHRNGLSNINGSYRCTSPANGENPSEHQSDRASPASDSHSTDTSQCDAVQIAVCDGSDEADDDDSSLDLIKCRNRFREQINYSGQMYCDFKVFASDLPYFHINDQYRAFSPNGLHLVVCVHGLDGSSADLRLVKTYLELGLPGANVQFLMSERNTGDAYSDLETMADR